MDLRRRLVVYLGALLGVASSSEPAQTLGHGEQMRDIARNPAAEIDERIGDTVRLCITLLLFFGATLRVAWLAANRALASSRAALHQLARQLIIVQKDLRRKLARELHDLLTATPVGIEFRLEMADSSLKIASGLPTGLHLLARLPETREEKQKEEQA